jgi:probable rRNA maturation factor
MNLCLDIQVASTATIPPEAELEHWVQAALEGRRASAEVSLRIVDEPEIAALNRDYRGRDYATNVLSFPADLPPELELDHLGDIVICAPVVIREAREQDKAPHAHWAHMLVHGTLHLLGYDHIDEAEAGAMEALETAILATLGFGDPYRDPLSNDSNPAFDQEESTPNHD